MATANKQVLASLTLVWGLGLSATGVAQDTFTNPIISGGYPDPSICRVGEDFYIANSSFEYFPVSYTHLTLPTKRIV